MWRVIATCLLIAQVALGQHTSSGTDLSTLPSCAASCLASAIADSPCSATNQTCLCTNEALQHQVTVCVTANCTTKEALFTKNTTSTDCGFPIRDKSASYAALSNGFGIVSGIFVVVRFAFKIWANLELGLDDWLILITIISGVPSSVLAIHGTLANGLARDIWTVPYDQITKFGMYFYIMAVLYFLLVALLKLTLLFFYLRIFPSKPIRRLLWGTVAFNCVFGLVFVMVSIFQCKPVSYFWTKWSGETEGHCLGINAISWSNAVISIALDIWMLAIPMSQLKSLKLDWRKKIGVGMMFIVGAFVTIVSILRLQSLVKFGSNSTNPTWEYLEVSKYSTLEVNVGIICTCMPTVRLILVRIFPKLLGTTQRYYANYASSKTGRQTRPQASNNATATSHVETSRHRTESRGITCHKTYAVEYGDHDEVQLVQIRNLDYKSSKSDVSV